MSSSGAIRAGRAYVEMSADNTLLAKGLKQAERMFQNTAKLFQRIGRELLASGLAMASPLIAATKVFVTAGSELARMSQKTGASVESLSQLKFAAEESGIGADQLSESLTKMQKTLFAAGSGSKEAIDALREIGLSMADLKGLSPDQQFEKIGDAISHMAESSDRSGAAIKVFGRAGAELLPMFAGGAAGIDAFRARAQELGLTMSNETAAGALKLSQSFDDLLSVGKSVAITIGSAMAPVMEAMVKAATSAAQKIRDLAKSHKDLIIATGLAAAALIATGAAATAAEIGFSALGFAAGAAATAIGVLDTVVSVGLSPFGLLAGAVAAAGIALFKFTNIGSRIGQMIGAPLRQLASNVVTVFDGVRDRIVASDWAGAAAIVWKALVVVWDKGVLAIAQGWDQVTAPFQGVIDTVRSAWASMTGYLVTAWNITTKFIGENAGAVWEGLKSGMMGVGKAAVYVFSAMQVVVSNWRNAISAAWKNIEAGAVTAFETMKYYLVEVIPTALGWLAANGPKLIAGMFMEIWSIELDFYKKTWDFVSNFAPKLGKMLWDGIKGAMSAGASFTEAFNEAAIGGFHQDIEKTGLPQIQPRQQTDLEKSLNSEASGKRDSLQKQIDDAYQKNIAALKNLNSAMFGGGKSPSSPAVEKAQHDLEDAKKALDDLIKATPAKVNAQAPTFPNFQDSTGLESAIASGKSVGTFNAATAFGFGGPTDHGKEQVKKMEETNRILTDLLAFVRKNPKAFGLAIN